MSVEDHIAQLRAQLDELTDESAHLAKTAHGIQERRKDLAREISDITQSIEASTRYNTPMGKVIGSIGIESSSEVGTPGA